MGRVEDKKRQGITFSRPTAPDRRPHLLFYGPWPKLLFHGPYRWNYFFTALQHQKLPFHGP